MSSRLPQDAAQYNESQRPEEERKRREERRKYEEELRKYEEERKRYEAEAETYNKQTDLPEEPSIINVAVREKDTKKLVAVYSKTGTREYIPESIQIKYSGKTEEEIAKAKTNPNFIGFRPDQTKYEEEEIYMPKKEQFQTPPNIEWWNVPVGDKEGQIKKYQGYIDSEKQQVKENQKFGKEGLRQAQHVYEIERDYGAKIDYLKNNPPTYEQSMEIYKSKIESVEQEAKSVKGDFVYHGGDFTRYNQLIQTRNQAQQNVTYGENKNKSIDWSRLSKEQLATELKKQQERTESQKVLTPPEIWQQSREYAQQRAAGFSSTGMTLVDESGKPIRTPTQMNRAESQQYNKSIVNIQMPSIIGGMKPNTPQTIPQSEIDVATGFPKVTNPEVIKSKGGQPERNMVSPYLQATYWTAEGTDKTFTTKSDADSFLSRQNITQTSYIGFSPDGKPIQGAASPHWVVDNLNPITKERFPTRTFKTEAEALAYQKKFGKEEKFTGLVGNDFFAENEYVATKPSLITTAMTPRQSWLGAEIQRGNEQFDKDAQWLEKNPKSSNPLLAAYQTVAPVGLATGRSIGSAMAFGVNIAEQVAAPFLAEKIGVKVKPVAPITLGSDTSGIAVLPYQFDKGRFDVSSKEWASRQAQYIKKYGVVEYGAGLVFDYGGLTGVPRMILGGAKSVGGVVVKPLLPKIGQSAKSAAITNAPSKIFKQGETFASPSKNWDIIEKVQPVGFRKTPPKSTLPVIKKGDTPTPNPFGKERQIPYAVKQGSVKIGETIKSVPSKIKSQIPEYKTPNVLLKAGVITSKLINTTQEGLTKTKKTFDKWNTEGQDKTLPEGYSRKNTRLERMRDMMWSQETNTPSVPRKPSPFERKLKDSFDLYAASTKQNIKDNFKVLNNIDINTGEKISTPIIKFIKKDQKTPNRSFSYIHLGKKTQVPKLENMTTPKRMRDFVRKADLSIAVKKQAIKTKITDAKTELQTTGRIARDLFYQSEPKKEIVPFKTKQELKNTMREDTAFNTSNVFKETNVKLGRGIMDASTTKIKGKTPKPVELDSSYTPSKRTNEIDFSSDVSAIFKKTNIKLGKGISNSKEPPIKFKVDEVKDVGEYMPRSKGKSKANKNIFIEDKANDLSDFFSKQKSKERQPNLRQEYPTQGKRTYYSPFKKESVVEALTKQKKENLAARLKGNVNLPSKKSRYTPIEQLKNVNDQPTVRDFVAQGEKRKKVVENMRSEKKLELPERNVSIFKVPYKETELDKMLKSLGKKKKEPYKKVKDEDKPNTKEVSRNIFRDDTGLPNISPKGLVSIMEKPKPKPKIESKIKDLENIPESASISGKKGDKTKSTTPLVVPPTPKETKKKPYLTQSSVEMYETVLHENRPQLSARNITSLGIRTSLGSRESLAQNISPKQSQKSFVESKQITGEKQKTQTKQNTKLFETQKIMVAQKSKTQLREKQATPSPQIPKARSLQVFKQVQPQRMTQKLKPIFPKPPPKTVMPIPIVPPPKSKVIKKKVKKSKTEDFLGNTRLDKIEGFFKRKDIITGDKAVAKQLGQDIRYKEGKLSGLGFSGKRLKI